VESVVSFKGSHGSESGGGPDSDGRGEAHTVTPFDPLPASEWGILLSLAVALGGSLYLGLLGLSLFPLIPGTPDTFGPLGLLASPPVTILAGLLYLTVWGVRGHPALEFLWEFANIGIRAIAVTLLAAVVVGGSASPYGWIAAVGAGAVAGFIQHLRLGWMLLDHHSDWVPARRWIQKLGGDTATLGLLWLTLLLPRVGPVVSGVGLIGVIVMSRSAYRSGRFSRALVSGLVGRLRGRKGWRGRGNVPGWVVRALDKEGAGALPIHATPAALVWTHRPASFQDGWLVLSDRGALLCVRNLSRLREVPLDGMTVGSISKSPHLTRISLADGDGDLALLIPRGGPEGEEVGDVLIAGRGRKPLTP